MSNYIHTSSGDSFWLLAGYLSDARKLEPPDSYFEVLLIIIFAMLLFYRENGVAKNVCMQLVYKMLLIKRGVTTVAAVVRVNFPFVKNCIYHSE